MKPHDRCAADPASLRRYVIAYAIYIVIRCILIYPDPKPIRISTLVFSVALGFTILFAVFRQYLRIGYGVIILAILILELIFRDTGIKALVIAEATLAFLLAVIAFRGKEVST